MKHLLTTGIMCDRIHRVLDMMTGLYMMYTMNIIYFKISKNKN